MFKLQNKEVKTTVKSLQNNEFYKRYVHYCHTGDRGGAYRSFVGRPEGKSPLGGWTHRWDDDITVVLQVGRAGTDWVDPDQDRVWWRALVNAVMKRRVP
jgi:hypothetical protein